MAEARREGRQSRETALRIDPDNATAIAYDAWTTAFVENRWAAAAAAFERAIELEPANSSVLRVGTMFARVIGRSEMACRMGEYALARDPLCSHCAYELSRAYRTAGRLDEAEKAIVAYRTVTGRGGGWHTLATILLLKGDPSGALEMIDSAPDPEDPFYFHGRAIVLHSLGRQLESEAALSRLESGWPREHPDLIAEVYAWYGDLERARAWGQAAIDGDEASSFPRLDRTSPFLQSLFDTPEGQSLLSEIGLADDQVAGIPFDVHLPLEGSTRLNGS